jgi:hypothetical protein
MATGTTRDSIPRLHRLVDHAKDQLLGLDAGMNTFEDCRQRYLETQQRLVLEGRGRITVSRISDDERNWSPTRDCLQELMRWGALDQGKLPSERKFVVNYRDERYSITPRGSEMAEAARRSRAEFTDAVTACVIEAHPYFSGLLTTLRDGPIVCPLVSEGDVAAGRQQGRSLEDWVEWGNARIAGEPTIELTLRELKRGLARLRGRRADDKPSNKETSQALTEGFSMAGFAARGITMDHVTIKALLQWGSELLLFDQSRWVPAHPQAAVIWGCTDVELDAPAHTVATRRGLAEYGGRVARAIVEAYREQADADASKMDSPFIPVHRVRAQAAAGTGVTRALVDRVLVDLVDGNYPEVGAHAAVFVGSTTQLPNSEPPFRYRGARRLVLQITPIT